MYFLWASLYSKFECITHTGTQTPLHAQRPQQQWQQQQRNAHKGEIQKNENKFTQRGKTNKL